MDKNKIDWDSVHRTNYESTAFWDIHWIDKAKDLYVSAKKLEPEIVRLWQTYQEHVKDTSVALVPDHYHGPYFMLLAFAVENLLKAAIIKHHGLDYRMAFRERPKFPEQLKKHDLIELSKDAQLVIADDEEDLLRRLTRSAIWFGRYPVPLDYCEMSGVEEFNDGEKYSVSWLGASDIERFNNFILSLPARLELPNRF
jgi:hypothetical protein